LTATYLIPAGLLTGDEADRAVMAGQAHWLAGGPAAFSHVTVLSRQANGSGSRQPLDIASAADSYPDELRSLGQAPAAWGGFGLKRPLIMGIINVTPDSFSDGGDHGDTAGAVAFGEGLLEAGADILDIGGESTRPGAAAISVEEEIRRVIPVIQQLAAKGVAVSVDTRHAAVMSAAVAAGARIINDVTALTGDPDSQRVAAQSGADLVLMHMQGEPQTMQKAPHYADVTLDLLDYFTARLSELQRLGVSPARISLDPGIGFGKNDQHNMRLMRELAVFHCFGCPLTLGVSRKSFVGRFSRQEKPKERMPGSLAAGLNGLDRGVQIIRVHDVAETYQGLAIWRALRASG
jgi:dihydropteroate synthase